MSWIRTVPEQQATPELKPIYDRLRERSRHRRVSHLWQALALDARALEGVSELHAALMADPSPLTVTQAELIAVVVSATNGCDYCVAHHGPRLAEACGDEALARAVALDYREANLAARDRVLLDCAVAMTCEPAERTRADVERLREYGWDDAQILKATAIAAFYNMVNRLVSALGVERESDVEHWAFGAQR